MVAQVNEQENSRIVDDVEILVGLTANRPLDLVHGIFAFFPHAPDEFKLQFT